MNATDRLQVQEVSPRDGLQMEPAWVETADKVRLIDALSCTGVTRIEASSFVSARAIPMLRDTAAVFEGVCRVLSVTYVTLVPNLRGAGAALMARTDELNFVMSASATHNRVNMGMTPKHRSSVSRPSCRLPPATAFRSTPLSQPPSAAHLRARSRRSEC